MLNPTVPWAHDYRSLPVAKCISIDRYPDKLVAVCQFATADMNPMAEQVYRMVKAGFLNACSIGFRPIRWSYNEARGGIDFHEVELVEFSIVPIPAHPQALIAAGVDTSTLRQWAATMLSAIDGSSTRKDESVGGIDTLVPSAVTDARRLLVNYLTSLGDQASESRYDQLRECIQILTAWIEGLNARSMSHRRHDPDEILVHFADSPDDEIEITDGDMFELPSMVRSTLRAELGPTIADSIRTAINFARGRID
jgi:HK97 family phage prohead protease